MWRTLFLCALLTREARGACRTLSERDLEARALRAAELALPGLVAKHCKIGADEPPFIAEQRMQHCRERLLAVARDDQRKALLAQCEKDELEASARAARGEEL